MAKNANVVVSASRFIPNATGAKQKIVPVYDGNVAPMSKKKLRAQRRSAAHAAAKATESDKASGKARAEVVSMGPGTFLAYASASPAAVRVEVLTSGNDPDSMVPVKTGKAREAAFEHDARTGALTVGLGAVGHHRITIEW